MAWDFSTEPEFEEKLHWMREPPHEIFDFAGTPVDCCEVMP